MTMHHVHSPKPKIFGKGYGEHVSYNYGLMKTFFWLGWKMLVNMFIPRVFYECAHWEVIDLYHKMAGRRFGTDNPKRCEHCGSNLEPRESAKSHAAHETNPAIKKEPALANQPPTADEDLPQRIGEINHPDHLPKRPGIEYDHE